MVRRVEAEDTADDTPSVAEVIALPTVRERARYGEEKRLNPLAMAGSVILVGGLLASLLTMNIATMKKQESSLAVFDVHSLAAPPAPPPPEPPPEPVEEVRAPTPVVAPPPLVRSPLPPVQIMTSPTPAPEISIPGPPAPSPQSAPPAIESVGDLSSKMIAAAPPRYPHESRRKREQGTVVLMVVLGVDGRVANISISRSSGFDRLDQAALHAVRRWRWSPTRRGGTAVMVRGLVEIPFVLQDR